MKTEYVAHAGKLTLYRTRDSGGTCLYAAFAEGPGGPKQAIPWDTDRGRAMRRMREEFVARGAWYARRGGIRQASLNGEKPKTPPSLTDLVDHYGGEDDDDAYDPPY